MNETEIERLVVRLVGDSSDYQRMLVDASTQATSGLSQISNSLYMMGSGFVEMFANPIQGAATVVCGAIYGVRGALDVLVAGFKLVISTVWYLTTTILSALVNGLTTAVDQVYRLGKSLLGFNYQGQTTSNILQNWLITIGGLIGMASVWQSANFGVNLANEAEQAQVSFTSLLKSEQQAAALLKQLSDLAASTPFEFPQLRTAAKSLLSAGFAARDITPMMRNLGDVTSAMGTGAEGIQRATYALMQMKQANRILGGDLMQLTNAGIPAQKLLQVALGKTGEQIHHMAAQGHLGARELNIFFDAIKSGKGLEAYLGGMEKQSKTLSGLWSTLKDNVGITMTAITQRVIAALGIKDLIKMITNTMEKYTETIIRSVESLISYLTPYAKALWGWLTADGGIMATVTVVVSALQLLVTPLLSIASIMYGMFTPFLITGMLATKMISNFIRDIGGFEKAWLFVKPVVIETMNVINSAVTNTEKVVSAAFMNLGNYLSEVFKTITGNAGMSWVDIRTMALDALMWIEVGFQNLQPIIDTVWATMKYRGFQAFDFIRYYLQDVIPVLINNWRTYFLQAFAFMVDQAEKAFNLMYDIAGQIGPMIAAALTGGIVGGLALANMRENIQKQVDAFTKAAETAHRDIPKHEVQQLEKDLKAAAEDMSSKLGISLQEAFAKLKKERMGQIFENPVAKDLKAIGALADDAGGKLGTAMGGAFKQASNFDAAIQGSKEAMAHLSEYRQGLELQSGAAASPQVQQTVAVKETSKKLDNTNEILHRIYDVMVKDYDKDPIEIRTDVLHA